MSKLISQKREKIEEKEENKKYVSHSRYIFICNTIIIYIYQNQLLCKWTGVQEDRKEDSAYGYLALGLISLFVLSLKKKNYLTCISGCIGSLLWHIASFFCYAESFIVAHGLLSFSYSAAYGILVPHTEVEHVSPAL